MIEEWVTCRHITHRAPHLKTNSCVDPIPLPPSAADFLVVCYSDSADHVGLHLQTTACVNPHYRARAITMTKPLHSEARTGLLGSTVRDTISGFEGIVIGEATYLYAASQVYVAPTGLTSNQPIAPMWLDAGRVEVLKHENHAGFMMKEVPKAGERIKKSGCLL